MNGWRHSVMALAVGTVLLTVPGTAQAQLFGGGGSFMDDIGDAFEEWMGGGSWEDVIGLSDVATNEAQSDPEVILRRQAAATAAGTVGYLPSLLAGQLLDFFEEQMQTEYLWLTVKALEEDESSAAMAQAEELRDEYGTKKISWTKDGANEQHFYAFVEPAGTDVTEPEFMRGHVGEMVAMRTAAGEELATALAAHAELQKENAATLQQMMELSTDATGTTEAVQAQTQVLGMVAVMLDQQATMNAMFHKVMMTGEAEQVMSQRNAFQQRAFALRDMIGGEPFGWPGYKIGLGGAGNVGEKHEDEGVLNDGGDWLGF